MPPKFLNNLIKNDDIDTELERAIHWSLASTVLGYNATKNIYNLLGFKKVYNNPAEYYIPKNTL